LDGTQEMSTVLTADCVVEVKLPPVHPAKHNAPKKRRLSAALRSILLLPFSRSRTNAGESIDSNVLSVFAPCRFGRSKACCLNKE